MAAINALPFPVYGQAYRLPVVFRDTSGNLLVNWSTAVANAYPDNSSGTSATIAEAPVGSGYGYIDLTAAQMTCSMCGVIATISNTNFTAFAAAVQPLNLGQFTGRYDAQTVQRFEQMIGDIYSGVGLNGASQQGAAWASNNPDGSTHFAGTVYENTTSAVRSKVN